MGEFNCRINQHKGWDKGWDGIAGIAAKKLAAFEHQPGPRRTMDAPSTPPRAEARNWRR
jgi:hypothetical protein